MKKIISNFRVLTIVVFVAISLTACSGSSPSKTVDSFLSDLKSNSITKDGELNADKYIIDSNDNVTSLSEDEDDPLKCGDRYIASFIESYKINGENIESNGNNATVNVTIKSLDLYETFKNYVSIKGSSKLIKFLGNDDMNGLYSEMLTKEYMIYDESTVDVKLEKSNSEWKIQGLKNNNQSLALKLNLDFNPDELANDLISNFAGKFIDKLFK